MTIKANIGEYKEFIEQSNTFNKQYRQYVDVYVHKANKELYAMLAEILDFAKSVMAEDNKGAIIATLRRVLKDEHGINTTSKTGDLGVLLRLILRGAHRKTIFTYKRVLQQAIDNGVCAEGLVDYIEANGGIEKLNESTDAIAKRNKYEVLLNDKKNTCKLLLTGVCRKKGIS